MHKFGLIGHPISHSLSPFLFKAAYEGKFPYELIEGEDFETSYQKFLNEYDAINVTAPFKEKAFLAAELRSPECEAIGAANILIKTEDGKIRAANSDTLGVTGALTQALEAERKIRQTSMIVGCGGAAKAAAYAMGKAGYLTIIVNRSLEKAEEYAQRLNIDYGMEVLARPIEEFRKWFREAGVVIYTLPVAIDTLESLSSNDIRGNSFLRKESKIILEANYKDPAFTEDFIRKLQKVNPKIRFIDGKEWLLHQAVGAYEIFTGIKPDLGKMRKVL